MMPEAVKNDDINSDLVLARIQKRSVDIGISARASSYSGTSRMLLTSSKYTGETDTTQRTPMMILFVKRL